MYLFWATAANSERKHTIGSAVNFLQWFFILPLIMDMLLTGFVRFIQLNVLMGAQDYFKEMVLGCKFAPTFPLFIMMTPEDICDNCNQQ